MLQRLDERENRLVEEAGLYCIWPPANKLTKRNAFQKLHDNINRSILLELINTANDTWMLACLQKFALINKCVP
ncbi:hypothetical protein D3C77_294170 [compost metagenome]